MTTLGINVTTNDPETTWGNLHTIHPETKMKALALSSWKLAAQLADEENPNWELIEKLQALARQFDQLDQEEWQDEVEARTREWSLQHEEERPE